MTDCLLEIVFRNFKLHMEAGAEVDLQLAYLSKRSAACMHILRPLSYGAPFLCGIAVFARQQVPWTESKVMEPLNKG